jgi:hypothetical protein
MVEKVKLELEDAGSGSPNAAKSLDFSGQIVHCDLARKHARVSSLLRRHRQRKPWRRFHLNIERQECSLPSLTSTRLMSLVSTLETLCIHCSKLQQLASERNKCNSCLDCIA